MVKDSALYDLIERLEKIDPWTKPNIQKAIDSHAKYVVYTFLALIFQNKTKDYLPMVDFLEILGKRITVDRLKVK